MPNAGTSQGVGIAAAAAIVIVLIGAAVADALTGGPEIQVNTTIAGHQREPAIAPDGSGGFTVVWWSEGQDGDGRGVYLRRFGSAGNPLTGEIPVNTHTLDNQHNPAIAPDPGGGFTVAWDSSEQDGDGSGVYARRFNGAGTPLTPEVEAHTTFAGAQDSPAVAPDGSGGFFVVWESFGQDGSGEGIYARHMDAAGGAITAEVPVNVTTANSQRNPAVAPDGSGGFFAVWESNQDGDGSGVYARRFNGAGGALTGEIPVNVHTPGGQGLPAVAPDGSGGFTVAWESNEQDGDEYGIYARRFNGAGAPLTGEIPVNTYTEDSQESAAIAPDSGGGFTVAWKSFGQDGDDYGIYARRFNGAGAPLTGEIPVNAYTTDYQDAPAISSDGSGRFTVAWDSNEQDGDGSGVYARRFAEPPPPPPASQPRDSVVTLRLLGRRLRVNRRGIARLRLRCPVAEQTPPCRGRVALRTRGRLRFGRGRRAKRRRVVLARAGFRVAAGRRKAVRLRLRRPKLRLVLRRPRARRAVAIARVRDGAGNRRVVRKRLRLVPQRRRRAGGGHRD